MATFKPIPHFFGVQIMRCRVRLTLHARSNIFSPNMSITDSYSQYEIYTFINVLGLILPHAIQWEFWTVTQMSTALTGVDQITVSCF